MSSFQFVGFSPRQGFREKSDALILELYSHFPKDTHCSARCVMIDGKFFFQVIFVSRSSTFIAKAILDPKKHDEGSRNWMNQGLEEVRQSLLQQLNIYSESKAA